MPEHQSRTIVITGATRGLGRSLTQEMIRQGHTVIGCGRNEAAVAALQKECGSPHHFTRIDVSNDDEVADWAARVLDEIGPPDLLVNNAATINENAPLWEVSATEFAQVTAVNINGVANVIRHFVPAMIERGQGVIVNFSSGWGRTTSPEVAPYCASKWAIEGLTQALAQELPDGLAAVPVNPGIINTDMLQSCFGGSADSFPGPDDWAKQAAPFLLSLGTADNGQPLSVPL